MRKAHNVKNCVGGLQKKAEVSEAVLRQRQQEQERQRIAEAERSRARAEIAKQRLLIKVFHTFHAPNSRVHTGLLEQQNNALMQSNVHVSPVLKIGSEQVLLVISFHSCLVTAWNIFIGTP